MKINQVLEAARVCLTSKAATLCLVGQSGVAKTASFVKGYKELGYDGYVLIRPALLADAADLVGLPDFEIIHHNGKDHKVTTFARPDFLPFEGQKTLFILDEINRGTKDVANALFGMIESDQPRVGQHIFPSGSGVVATCNPPTDNYGGVLDLRDNAWSSRLCFVKIEPTIEDFTEYGRKSGNVSNVMLDFLNKNEKFFGTVANFDVDMFFNKDENGGEEANLRSLEKASRLFEAGKKAGVERGITFELIRGTKGLEFTTSFMQFADEYKTHVTVDDILKDPKNIERFDKTAMSSINKILEDYKHKAEKGELDPKTNKNFIKFLEVIPQDTFMGFAAYVSRRTTNEDTFFDKLGDEIAAAKELEEKITAHREMMSDKDPNGNIQLS